MVEPRDDELDRLKQLPEPVQRQEVRLERNEDFAGGGQRVDRQNPQGRGAVDDLIVVRSAVGRGPFKAQFPAQNPFPPDLAGQFDFGPRQIEVRGNDPEAFGRLPADRTDRGVAGHHVINRRFAGLRLHPQIERGVGLRVHVDQKDPFPPARERRGQVDRRGGLSDTPFLIHDRYGTHRPFQTPLCL